MTEHHDTDPSTRLTPQEVYDAVLAELDAPPVDEDGGAPIRVVVAGFVVGADVERVADLTGIPADEVKVYADRLTESQLWRDGLVVLTGDEDAGVTPMTVITYSMVADGIFSVAWTEGDVDDAEQGVLDLSDASGGVSPADAEALAFAASTDPEVVAEG